MESSLHKPKKDTSKTQHLCVLVHGLWGNGSHLNYLSTSLRNRYSEDDGLILLVCKRNASSFTYDGIEVGGERVAREIEDSLEELKRDGYKVDRFSIVGYSLGGLIARYAIGLLDYKGYFDFMRPVNYTSFASPHLGVRTPLMGYPNTLWNVLGARTLSASGRQLFTVDAFRDTGRPILGVLADPDSIFVHALAKFENKILYTNIVNDRTAVYYTTGISRIDPYVDLSKIKINYLPDYEDVILDPLSPYEVIRDQTLPSFTERVKDTTSTVLRRTPIYFGLSIIIPIAVVFFLVNAGIQTIRSQKRIRLHEDDNDDDSGYKRYRVSWMVQDVRAGLEDVFEATNSAQRQEYLPEGSEELADGSETEVDDEHTPANSVVLVDGKQSTGQEQEKEEQRGQDKEFVSKRRRRSTASFRDPDFPTLALTKEQFGMIRALDNVGFQKFGVHIHKSSHSHAAMIVRTGRAAFSEGKVVVRHWLERTFKMG